MSTTINPDKRNLDDWNHLRKEVAEFQSPHRLKSSWQLASMSVFYALVWFVSIKLLAYSVWLTLPLIFLQAGILVRLFIIFHDCGHGSFFKSKRFNDFWGVITGFLSFTPYHCWRGAHARHHGTSANLDQRGEGDVWMMTLEEYTNAPWRTRLWYRFYRHPLVMFLLGPLLIMLITNRVTAKAKSRVERFSVHLTNLAIAVVSTAIIYFLGLKIFLLLFVVPIYIAHIAGVWLFYIQHQFEGVYWARSSKWDMLNASLQGGSFYQLPSVLRWFTGNIGYHHLHHLNSRIPNYNLVKCHQQIPLLQTTKPLKLWKSLKSIKLHLWDEDKARMISFREISTR